MQQSIFTNKQISWFDLIIAVAVIALFVPLLGYAYVGLFSRYVGDDFCIDVLFETKGVLGVIVYWYFVWSGRYSGEFFTGITWLLGGAKLAPYLPFIVLTVWVAGLTLAILQLGLMVRLSRPVLASFLIAGLVLFATLDGTPDIFQSLYSRINTMHHTLALVFLVIYAGVVLYRVRKSENSIIWPWALLAATLTFVAGGFSETYVVLQTTVIIMGGLICVVSVPDEQRKRVCLYLLVAGLIGSLLALWVTISAPGNYARQEGGFPVPPSLFQMVKSSLLYALYMLARPILSLLQPILIRVVPLAFPEGQRWLEQALELSISPFPSVVTLILPALLAFKLHPQISDLATHKKIKQLLILIPIVGFIFVVSSMVPTAYAMSAPPPPRLFIIPQFVLVCTIAFWGYLAGLTLRQMRGLRNRRISPFLGRFGYVVVITLLLLASIVSTQRILTLGATYKDWAAQWDAIHHQITTAKAQGLRTVTVPPLADVASPVSGLMGLQSYNTNPGNWVLPCIVDFYDLDAIIVKEE